MSYAGTVLDMIKRQKMNRDLQKKKRSHRKAQLEDLTSVSGLKFNTDFGKNLSAAEIEQRNAKIRSASQEAASRTRLSIVLVVTTLIIILTLIGFIL